MGPKDEIFGVIACKNDQAEAFSFFGLRPLVLCNFIIVFDIFYWAHQLIFNPKFINDISLLKFFNKELSEANFHIHIYT